MSETLNNSLTPKNGLTMNEADKKFAAARAEELEQQLLQDENIRKIQHLAYTAGYHAALSEIISVLMQKQAKSPRTPFEL